MSARAWLASLAVLALVPPAAAGVIVVEPNGALPQIQAAVDLAVDGDVILVKTGDYAGFTVVDKALSIVADAGPRASVTGAVQVLGLAATRAVLLSGFEVRGAYGVDPLAAHGLVLHDDLGTVRVQDCTLVAAGGTSDFCNPRAGAEIVASLDVAFTSCWIQGGTAVAIDFADGGSGLHAVGSRVALYDCWVFGGHGGHDFACGYGYGDGRDGGRGAWIEGGELFASGTSLIGGNGGDPIGPVAYPASGRSGLEVSGNAEARLLASYCAAGGNGLPEDLHHPTTVYAPITTVAPATVQTLAGSARHLRTPRIVRAGERFAYQIQGEAGDVLTLFLNVHADWRYTPSALGVELWAIDAALRELDFGAAGANGAAKRPSVVPTVPPASESLVYRVQVLHAPLAGGEIVGAPRTIVIVGPGH